MKKISSTDVALLVLAMFVFGLIIALVLNGVTTINSCQNVDGEYNSPADAVVVYEDGSVEWPDVNGAPAGSLCLPGWPCEEN